MEKSTSASQQVPKESLETIITINEKLKTNKPIFAFSRNDGTV